MCEAELFKLKGKNDDAVFGDAVADILDRFGALETQTLGTDSGGSLVLFIVQHFSTDYVTISIDIHLHINTIAGLFVHVEGEVGGSAELAGTRSQSVAGGITARAIGAQSQSVAALMTGSQVLTGTLSVALCALEEGVLVHFGLLWSGSGSLLDIGPRVGVGVLPNLSGRLGAIHCSFIRSGRWGAVLTRAPARLVISSASMAIPEIFQFYHHNLLRRIRWDFVCKSAEYHKDEEQRHNNKGAACGNESMFVLSAHRYFPSVASATL